MSYCTALENPFAIVAQRLRWRRRINGHFYRNDKHLLWVSMLITLFLKHSKKNLFCSKVWFLSGKVHAVSSKLRWLRCDLNAAVDRNWKNHLRGHRWRMRITAVFVSSKFRQICSLFISLFFWLVTNLLLGKKNIWISGTGCVESDPYRSLLSSSGI